MALRGREPYRRSYLLLQRSAEDARALSRLGHLHSARSHLRGDRTELACETPGRRGAAVNWKLKGLVQKGLSVTPGGLALNDRLQRVCGGLRNFEQDVADKIEDWKLTIRYLR